jgi:hypothetical protein
VPNLFIDRAKILIKEVLQAKKMVKTCWAKISLDLGAISLLIPRVWMAK